MITFKGKPVTLNKEQLEKGETFPEFKVVDNNMDDLISSNIKGKKIYLSVPSLDTKVCSMEVAKFINFVREREDVTCISISMDLPFALQRWCLAQDNTNVITSSDFKYHEFAKASGTLINELGLLTRAVFVVDEQDVIQYVEYVEEVSNEPNYAKVLEIVDSI